jgi:hypothetical protein
VITNNFGLAVHLARAVKKRHHQLVLDDIRQFVAKAARQVSPGIGDRTRIEDGGMVLWSIALTWILSPRSPGHHVPAHQW